jgi:hypothetical protein
METTVTTVTPSTAKVSKQAKKVTVVTVDPIVFLFRKQVFVKADVIMLGFTVI